MYAINSKGFPVETENPLNPKKTELRLSEIKEKLSELNLLNVFVNFKKFEETIVFFEKTEIPSDSKDIHIANNIAKYPEIFSDKKKLNYIKSIVSAEKKWYFVTAFVIELKRNFFDGEIISFNCYPSVSYSNFLKNAKEEYLDISSKESSFRVLKEVVSFSYEKSKEREEAIRKAFECKETDKNSNIETSLISLINSKKELKVYPIYQKVKIAIRRNVEGAEHIKYDQNKITFNLNDFEYAIYIIDENRYIAGGATIEGFDKLKEYFKNGNFKEEEWFIQKVKPFIERSQ